MAKVTVLPAHNLRALADHAGSSGGQQLLYRPDQGTLQVEDVTQPDLDTALVDYIADQANIDNDFEEKMADEKADGEKDQFDDKSDLTALIKVMVEELNVLRALHAIPDLNFGTVNASVRSKIGQP